MGRLVSKLFTHSFSYYLLTYLLIVIGLSEDILVTSVALANYEKYSSTVKEFQLLASTSFPTEEWINLGVYEAVPRLGEQYFNVTTSSVHTRYLKFKFLTHYDNEALCTLSQIKVHGTTVIASFKEEVERSDTLMRDMLSQLSLEQPTIDTDDDVSPGNSSVVDSVVTEGSSSVEVDEVRENTPVTVNTSEIVEKESLSVEVDGATNTTVSDIEAVVSDVQVIETEVVSKDNIFVSLEGNDTISTVTTEVETENNTAVESGSTDEAINNSSKNLGTAIMSVLPESAVNFVKEVVLSPLGIITADEVEEVVDTEPVVSDISMDVASPTDIDNQIVNETVADPISLNATLTPSTDLEQVNSTDVSELSSLASSVDAVVNDIDPDSNNTKEDVTVAAEESDVSLPSAVVASNDTSPSLVDDTIKPASTNITGLVNSTVDATAAVELLTVDSATNTSANVSLPVVPVISTPSSTSNRDAGAATINLSCWDQLRFSDFQSKMLSKLQKNDSSSDGSTSSSVSTLSSSQDNVFRQLMQKIKTLEMGYAIIEMYSIQVSDCYRLVMADMMVNINDTKSSLAVNALKMKELEQIIEESRRTIKYEVFDSLSISFSHRDMVLGMILVTLIAVASLIVSITVILLIKSKKWYTTSPIDDEDEDK